MFTFGYCLRDRIRNEKRFRWTAISDVTLNWRWAGQIARRKDGSSGWKVCTLYSIALKVNLVVNFTRKFGKAWRSEPWLFLFYIFIYLVVQIYFMKSVHGLNVTVFTQSLNINLLIFFGYYFQYTINIFVYRTVWNHSPPHI